MKRKFGLNKGKVNFGVVSVTAVLFLGIAAFVAFTTRSMMVNEARNTVENVVKAAVGRIDNLMTGVESAVDNSAWVVQEHLDDPDYMVRIARELVANNDFVVGSAVAFVPDYYKAKTNKRLFAPYCNKEKDKSIRVSSLEYEYAEESDRNEWFCVARHTGKPHWCEPYFDDGGADIMMSTYSVPIKNGAGKVVAILTADISLADLTDRVAKLKPYAESYAVMRSSMGKTLVAPPAGTKQDNDVVRIAGKSANGWTVELVCPLANILRGAQLLVTRIAIFSFVGLGLIFFVSWTFSSRLQRATAANERIESELSIANHIQTSLANITLPDYASAKMRPAKEVGGDRFDFEQKGSKTFFAIGDASGKGVPAALYTSLVGTGFSFGASLDMPPAELVSRINDLVSKRNDSAMFVTYFAGVIDDATETLTFCNAGHNPPVIIRADGRVETLDVRSNMALGVMEGYKYKEQTVDFRVGDKILLYTDGVTESVRADDMQFGMQRLLDLAKQHAKDTPADIVGSVVSAVDTFAAGCDQFDDITVMTVEKKNA